MPPSLPAKKVGTPSTVPIAAACWSGWVDEGQVFLASLMSQQGK